MTPTARDRPAVATWWWWPPAGGVLFALAYPPLDLLPLAILGLWPLFAFLDREAELRPRTGFVGGYLFGLAHFVVAIRADDEAWQSKGPGAFPREVWPRITLNPRELLSAPSGKIMTYSMTPIAISSTAIRNLAAEGASIRYLTPDPVVEYVRSHRLYAKPK